MRPPLRNFAGSCGRERLALAILSVNLVICVGAVRSVSLSTFEQGLGQSGFRRVLDEFFEAEAGVSVVELRAELEFVIPFYRMRFEQTTPASVGEAMQEGRATVEEILSFQCHQSEQVPFVSEHIQRLRG